jgi:hypothetical protein
MRFRGTIMGTGKTSAGIAVPDEVMQGLGGGKRPAVTVSIGDYRYRSSIGAVDGAAMLPISVEHRQNAGLAAGDEVDVELELDTTPREVSVPDDLAAALDAEPAARRTFDGLSYSLKSYHVGQVEGTKNPETRQRRIEKAVATLREGRQR